MSTDGPPQQDHPQDSPSPTPPPASNRRVFLLGMGIGAIPLVLAMIGLWDSLYNYNSTVLTAGGIFYALMFLAMIVLVSIKRTRQVGLGMLTSLLASPVIFFIGCMVMLSQPRG